MASTAPAPSHRRGRIGFTVIEMLLVVGTLAVIFLISAPRLSAIRATTQLRAARQQLTAVFAAARVAALQKGKPSTVVLAGNSATVTVLSGLNFAAVPVLGPIRLDSALGVSMTAVAGSPTTIRWSARGLLTPVPAQTLMYQLRVGSRVDTVCVSTVGLILPKGCAL